MERADIHDNKAFVVLFLGSFSVSNVSSAVSLFGLLVTSDK